MLSLWRLNNFLPITLNRDSSRLLKSYVMCPCLSGGETVRLVLFVSYLLIIVELWSICSWPIYLWTPHTFTFFFLLFFPLTLLYTCLCLLKKVRFYFLPNSCCLILSLFFCISCLSWEFCCFARLLCFTTVKSAAHVQIIPNNTLFFLLIMSLWPISQSADI